MSRLDVGGLYRPGLPLLLPQPARVSHCIGFVDHDELTLCGLERVLEDPRDAKVGVEVLLDSDLLLGAFLEPPAHADVEPLCVLTHDEQIDLSPVLLPQR